MSANERRPAGAPSEACWPSLSLPEPTHASADDTAADHNLPTVEYLEGYEEGLIHGDVIGYQRARDEWHARAEVSAAIAQQIARMGPYDELEERRGRPERAAAARALWAERGIAL